MALSDEKYQRKQQALIERTARALDVTNDAAAELLTIGRRQSIRVNTLKCPDVSAATVELQKAGARLAPTRLMPEGFFITDGLAVVRDSNVVGRGEVYIQNAASWLPVLALSSAAGDTVLDMCAAPGGKTSHIAQYANNQVTIHANDNSRPRLHKLQANLTRLGVKNTTYTLHDATHLTKHYDSEYFDKILLDAPCSGEGMMTLGDKKAFESWSPAHIKRLSQLQKRLIVQAWQLLKPGGTLVYSTCTMAPEENEVVLDYLLRHNDDVEVGNLSDLRAELPNAVASVTEWNGKTLDPRVTNALRLQPSPEVEAFFVVKLIKL